MKCALVRLTRDHYGVFSMMRKKRKEGEGKKEEGNINEPRNTRSNSDLKPQTSNPISTPDSAPNLNFSASLTNPTLCMVQKALT